MRCTSSELANIFMDILEDYGRLEMEKRHTSWVRCIDEMPEERKKVLVSCTDGTVDVAHLHIWKDGLMCWKSTFEYYDLAEVEAWMDFPKAYRKD